MLKAALVILLVISCCLADGLDLPAYISKCSLSDPKLSRCLVKKANEVIPIIVKGDVSYNVPSTSPVTFAEAPFNATGLKYVLYNVYNDDWKNIRFTEASMDFKTGQSIWVATLDRAEVVAQNYSITEGKILDIPVSGHGKYNMTFEDMIIRFVARLRLYKKGEDTYLDYFDSSADFNCRRAYFHFENIQSTEESDVNAYIDENWEEFVKQVKPTLDFYSNMFLTPQMRAIMNAVPFSKLFLP